MSSLYQTYADIVKKETGYFANIKPFNKYSVGDIVILKNNIIKYYDNINAMFTFNMDILEAPFHGKMKFASEKVVVNESKNLSSSGNCVVNYSIGFSKKNQIFFSLEDVWSKKLQNQNDLSIFLKEQYLTGSWKTYWCVITEVITAGFSLIAMSKNSGSQFNVAFEIKPGGEINDTGINSQFDILNCDKKNLLFEITMKSCTPLINYSQYDPDSWWNKIIKKKKSEKETLILPYPTHTPHRFDI